MTSSSSNVSNKPDFMTEYGTLSANDRKKLADRLYEYLSDPDGYPKNKKNNLNVQIIFEFFGPNAGSEQYKQMDRAFDVKRIDEFVMKDGKFVMKDSKKVPNPVREQREDFLNELLKEFESKKLNMESAEYSENIMQNALNAINPLSLIREISEQIDNFIKWESNKYKADSVSTKKELALLKKHLVTCTIFQLGNAFSKKIGAKVEDQALANEQMNRYPQMQFLFRACQKNESQSFDAFFVEIKKDVKFKKDKESILEICSGEIPIIKGDNIKDNISVYLYKYVSTLDFYLLPNERKVDLMKEFQNEAYSALLTGVNNNKITQENSQEIKKSINELTDVLIKRYQSDSTYSIKMAERVLNTGLLKNDISATDVKKISDQMPQYKESVAAINHFIAFIKEKTDEFNKSTKTTKFRQFLSEKTGIESRSNIYPTFFEHYQDLFQLYVDLKNKEIVNENNPISKIYTHNKKRFAELENALDGILKHKLGDELFARIQKDIKGFGLNQNKSNLSENNWQQNRAYDANSNSSTSQIMNATIPQSQSTKVTASPIVPTIPTINIPTSQGNDASQPQPAPRGDRTSIELPEEAQWYEKPISSEPTKTTLSNNPITTTTITKSVANASSVPSLNIPQTSKDLTEQKQEEKRAEPPLLSREARPKLEKVASRFMKPGSEKKEEKKEDKKDSPPRTPKGPSGSGGN